MKQFNPFEVEYLNTARSILTELGNKFYADLSDALVYDPNALVKETTNLRSLSIVDESLIEKITIEPSSILLESDFSSLAYTMFEKLIDSPNHVFDFTDPNLNNLSRVTECQIEIYLTLLNEVYRKGITLSIDDLTTRIEKAWGLICGTKGYVEDKIRFKDTFKSAKIKDKFEFKDTYPGESMSGNY